ncbi:Transposase [Pseudomonas syringae pv. actinidiae]|uniref:Transposase n=1 Tax=Pseudomonas syringae pv. actinidiae TaxID=103796 RepID=A0A2V0QES6_PSESF|nr:Transposase [Pseudomonas syringae pv. actinidiae]
MQPSRAVPEARGCFTAGLLAPVMVGKSADHLPLHRQPSVGTDTAYPCLDGLVVNNAASVDIV